MAIQQEILGETLHSESLPWQVTLAVRYHRHMAKRILFPLVLALIGLTVPFFNPTPFTCEA